MIAELIFMTYFQFFIFLIGTIWKNVGHCWFIYIIYHIKLKMYSRVIVTICKIVFYIVLLSTTRTNTIYFNF